MAHIDLKIDCSRLNLSQLDELAKHLRPYLGDVLVAGEDLIYASGTVNPDDYYKVRKVLSWFNVTYEE